MTDNTGATEVQAAEVTQPQAGAGSSPQAGGAQTAQAASATAEGGTGNSDPSALARENADLRKEQAANRKRLQALEATQHAADEASLSELQKAHKRVAELEQQATELQTREQERTVQLGAVEVAARLNFRNPDVAYRLLDRSEIEYDDNSRPKNIEKLLKTLLEREPYLAKTAQADFGGGNRGTTPSGQPTMNDLIRAAHRG